MKILAPNKRSFAFATLIVLIHFTLIHPAPAQSQPTPSPQYPAPKNLGDPAALGRGIQRTMTLLATSTPEHRNTVKILFYGQSITEQDWWKTVASDLRRRFPHANLVIENRALGGFASQRLVKTAETDLYSFYPDLLIFHVYGAHNNYEDIIRRTRERTTAEVLMQTDHLNRASRIDEETDPARITPKQWDQFMNYKFLPDVAKEYGCAMLDQRNLWKQYLRDNGLEPAALLRDGVHLNTHGCYLMSELVKAYLVKRDDETIDPMNCATVKTLTVGKDLQWQNGKLTIEFTGNRVDAIVRDGQAAPAQIRIDGKRPSELPELYGFTRALARPGGKWPVVTCLAWEKPPILEAWTMACRKDPANPKVIAFTLAGSKTGPDGEGRSDRRFVSNSGRIVIEPQHWDLDFALVTLAGQKQVPGAFTVTWKVVSYFVDEFASPGIQDKTVETVVNLAQGLKNGKHTLELTGGPATPLAALRVYTPPVQEKRK